MFKSEQEDLKKTPQQRSRRYKELNGNFRMEKYNNGNKNLTGWAQQQSGYDR